MSRWRKGKNKPKKRRGSSESRNEFRDAGAKKTGPGRPQKKSLDSDRERPRQQKYSWEAEDNMPRGLLVIALFALAAIAILSFVDAAGELGIWADRVLAWIFGWGRYVMPAFFAVLGYVFLHPNKYALRLRNYVGLVFLLLSGSALLHLFLPFDSFMSAAQEGRGGGYLGIVLSYPLIRFAGIWATIVVLLGFFVSSLVIMLNTSLKKVLSVLRLPSLLRRILTQLKSRLHARLNGYEISGVAADDQNEDEGAAAGDVDSADQGDSTAEAMAPFTNREITATTGSVPAKIVSDPEQLTLMSIPKSRRRARIDIPLNLLSERHEKPTSGDIEENKMIIHKTLENFGINVEMGEVHVGPVVSQYTLKPTEGVKLTQITTLHNDIALALAAHPVRIEAPIPGKSLVGIEVPNKTAATVTLRDMLGSKQFKRRGDNLAVCLGKDVSGKPYLDSLEKMPHLLIAGATGSGKSVCIHGLIVSLLFQNSPDDLKLILVDPKRVELTLYNGIPHLLTPVITDVEKTVNALKWTIVEMERRYELLEKSGKRGITSYNAAADPDERMPYIVFIIDELADLMANASNSVEAAVVRLAQMSRAVGIHLVLATQRPSVNVITGLIKANMPARVAFSVASIVDSRTILDFAGAEKLLGRGDMLYINANLSKPRRLQGALVEELDIDRVVGYLKSKSEPDYVTDITARSAGVNFLGGAGMAGDDDASDELLGDAKEIILQAGKASASLLQRRLRIGYARAARILDILEEQGLIGPADGAKPREILMETDAETAEFSAETESDVTNTPERTSELNEQADDKTDAAVDEDERDRFGQNDV